MLLTLKINNLAVIEHEEIHFSTGLNVISGETGAGKSIIIGAIQLLLGGRAQADTIRTGAPEAQIEGLFDLKELQWIHDKLKKLDLADQEPGSATLLIRRIISRTGRHRIYINGNLVNLGVLQDICEGLIDLCGQNENQTLLKSQPRTELLDRYAEIEGLRKRWDDLRREVLTLLKEHEKLSQAQGQTQRELDFLNFQLEELEAAQLIEGEDDDLIEKKSLLQTSEQRFRILQQALGLLSGSSEEDSTHSTISVSDTLASAEQKLRTILIHDTSLESVVKAIEVAQIEIEAIIEQVREKRDQITFEETSIESLQERLNQISDIKRKYGGSIIQAIAEKDLLRSRIQQITFSADSLEKVSSQLPGEVKKTNEQFLLLIKKRKAASKSFSQAVTKELHDLGMDGALFLTQILEPTQTPTETTLYEGGSIDFLIQTNVGDHPKPLTKIASGGELSRILLAIRHTCSNRGPTGVYLFDEIDAGIGGRTAYAVGSKLAAVAAGHQVICITHLAQVAAFADHHLCVQKSNRQGKTYTQVITVEGKNRKEEMARMIGAVENSPRGLKAVVELLEEANRGKQKSRRSRSH